MPPALNGYDDQKICRLERHTDAQYAPHADPVHDGRADPVRNQERNPQAANNMASAFTMYQ